MIKCYLLKVKIIFIFVVIALFFSSCANIYTHPNAMYYTVKHKTLAILPPDVKIEENKTKKAQNIESKLELEKVITINAQNEIYSNLLKFVHKRKVYFDIQNIDRTNAMLLKIGYSDTTKLLPEELAQALGVDAILQSTFILSQRYNVGGGIVLAIIGFPYYTPFGILMATQPSRFADVNIRFFEGSNGILLYNYNHKFGGLNAKYISLIGKATNKIVKKSPYYSK